jgi:LPPG:FO 2-phospho-L-lactate transferase
MAEGLARALSPNALTVIANVGDDDKFYGLHVSPDIDTLIYTLADRIDRTQGWGVAQDTTNALSVLAELGVPYWMKLGDKDFGLHIWRSWRMAEGATLTEVTQEAGVQFGARARILPVTDEPVKTQLLTSTGWMDFQTWFVREKCAPHVEAVRFAGAENARITPEVQAAIAEADAIIFAPSNPLLSIQPMLASPGLREQLQRVAVPRLAVSPLIGGKAVKGPLGRLIEDFNLPRGSQSIVAAYDGLIDGFIADTVDAHELASIKKAGLHTLSTDILMPDPQAAERLAYRMLEWLAALVPPQMAEL